jgi:hypothetical protein
MTLLCACGQSAPKLDIGEEQPPPSTDRGGSLRAAHIAEVQSAAPRSYDFASLGSILVARNHAAIVSIAAGSIRFAPPHTSRPLELTLSGVGRVEPLDRPVANGDASVRRNRARQSWGVLDEWYVNGPLGVEHGFDIAERPPGLGPLTLAVAVGGPFVPVLADDLESIRFEATAPEPERGVARYSDLHAIDAAGRELSSSLATSADRILIRIDDRGAAYPITIDPLIWLEQPQLVANDGTSNNYFGSSVAVEGDTAIVGSIINAAYVFERAVGIWTQSQKLTASDAPPQGGFAIVALDGDTAIIGSPGTGAGAAYVFVRAGGVWAEQAKLTASDVMLDDQFGWAVAIAGETAVVTARRHDVGGNDEQGAAYVFVRSGGLGGTWAEEQRLTASDGAATDLFGESVDIEGDAIVVGAEQDDGPLHLDQGSAYLFTRSGSTWTQEQKLVATDGASYDYFGAAVALSAQRVLVTAREKTIDGTSLQGAAYVFRRDVTAWVEEQRITASDGGQDDWFGRSAALSNDVAVVGTEFDSGYQGSAYVFFRSGDTWTEHQHLIASDGASHDYFGAHVSLSGGTVLVGSRYNDVGAHPNQGSAYVFELDGQAPNGSPCGANVECGSFHCVDAVCCDTACGNGDVDDCEACSVALGAAADGACGPITDGTACDDDDACTQTETCQAGGCVGSDPITCPEQGGCHERLACDPATGECGTPTVLPDGASCDDGDACTEGDTCDHAECAGEPVTCVPMDDCHDPGTCKADTGLCDNPSRPDGSSCAGGVCVDGRCDVGGTGGNLPISAPLADDSDGCSLAHRRSTRLTWPLLAPMLLLRRRSRNRRASLGA